MKATFFHKLCCACPVLLLTTALSVQAQDRFNATEEVRPPAASSPLPPNARVVQMRIGEIVEITSIKTALIGTKDETAFYIPPEGNAIIQVVVEKKFRRRTYFAKALAAGETVGGIVERKWLDADGYRVKNPADEGRVQASIKNAPILFFVTDPNQPQTTK
jgi:hypothetical protein